MSHDQMAMTSPVPSGPNATPADQLVEWLRPATKVEDLGIPVGIAEDLMMRRVMVDRMTTVGTAAAQLGISHGVAESLAHSLREKALLEYLGANGRDYRIQLTELGQNLTAARMDSGRHVASMPVSLALYQWVVNAQTVQIQVDRPRLERAFADLTLDDDLLDQIGPAFVSGGAMFLYGPAGTGKTSLAERMNRLYDDPVVIPRFIEVDGQLLTVYDPSLHKALPDQPAALDRRWVLCERPLVVVGGELDLTMLDLHYDPISGLHVAPIQVMANNGILVVDDFGRQTVSPEAILNRWILPLSRRIDFLRSSTGTKVVVPFELKLVVSTNIEPTALGDDAFLRRLRNKIFIGPIRDAAFAGILEGSARHLGVDLADNACAHLIRVARHALGELRPYLAVDFCELAIGISRYEQRRPVLDRTMVDRVAAGYFVHHTPANPSADRDGPLGDPLGPRGPVDTGMRRRATDPVLPSMSSGRVFRADELDQLAASLIVDDGTG
ncbi:MAG: ATP-binding protein [Acidimicrobiales bacterium]